jgi:lipopolysaccharide export system permease protein
MKTWQKWVYGEVISAVSFITLGFTGLFFFFDFVDELQWVRSSQPGGYQVSHALGYVSLIVPSHLYELLPITVLIGSIYVMSRMAQTSEFTILRTSGLGPVMALKSLIKIGLVFSLITFVVGDYLSPACDKYAQLLKSRFLGQITIGQTGAWLKEKQSYTNEAVNVGALTSDGQMSGIRIFEFDNSGRLSSLTLADHGEFENNQSAWILSNAQRIEFAPQGANKEVEATYPSSASLKDKDLIGASKSIAKQNSQHKQMSTAEVQQLSLDLNPNSLRLLKSAQRFKQKELRWPNSITQEMVSVALLKPDRMGILDLFTYIQHLNLNSQSSQRYEIEFWKKVFYPISCLVMMVLALPFAYLHFRSGNITSFVFFGVMIGISFFLLNNVFGYIGNINQWAPWFAAAAPGLLYTLFSLTAFGWLVIRQ